MTGKRTDNRVNIRPARQLWLPLYIKGEVFASKAECVFPIEDKQLMENVVERGNLQTALRNVMRNSGSPGIDGMTVKELPEYLKRRWPDIRRQVIRVGSYLFRIQLWIQTKKERPSSHYTISGVSERRIRLGYRHGS